MCETTVRYHDLFLVCAPDAGSPVREPPRPSGYDRK